MYLQHMGHRCLHASSSSMECTRNRHWGHLLWRAPWPECRCSAHKRHVHSPAGHTPTASRHLCRASSAVGDGCHIIGYAKKDKVVCTWMSLLDLGGRGWVEGCALACVRCVMTMRLAEPPVIFFAVCRVRAISMKGGVSGDVGVEVLAGASGTLSESRATCVTDTRTWVEGWGCALARVRHARTTCLVEPPVVFLVVCQV